ncbi:HlyD family type I secretion periplasmic adaptor subunit [Polycladidibacter stylochi]|uniref:HlyD family type I secretion periplasmic adaptor subunit n=1 Tax=Polycladidibacter stylochi TaxID=1807766 RepID=UPI0009E895B1|nr:HlyD family type I secretion periplasmic adaptor subunit [Pseudovibrio stylochi]
MSTRALILDKSWSQDVPSGTLLPKVASLLVIVITFFGFGYWASTAPLAGAVVANGSFVATGQNKIVQHYEGGIIKDILVKEGDIVEQGQVLLRLDETAARANLDRLIIRQLRLQAMTARLEAEARGKKDLIFPSQLMMQAKQDKMNEIVLSQVLTFKAKNRNLDSEVRILQKGILALNERISGGQAQLVAVEEQIKLLKEELASKNKILGQGLIKKSDVLRTQRAVANLTGERGRILAEIGDSTERIARTEAQISRAKTEASQQAVAELQTAKADLDDVSEQIHAARKVLERVDVIAPVRGAVVDMRYHTAGGVIESGKNLMEILPLQDELIIEVAIQPANIDHVEKGQSAMVRLTALNQRTTPMLPAQVIYVSADALKSDPSNQFTGDIYRARIKILKEKIPNGLDIKTTPGMPAEVYITTRDRTFIDYLTEPLQDSMARAFREP